ncbi:MAG TPA: hypothetical protein VGM54_02240 [Chthoniobacter sp.]|jgi:hypothetical protein
MKSLSLPLLLMLPLAILCSCGKKSTSAPVAKASPSAAAAPVTPSASAVAARPTPSIVPVEPGSASASSVSGNPTPEPAPTPVPIPLISGHPFTYWAARVSSTDPAVRVEAMGMIARAPAEVIRPFQSRVEMMSESQNDDYVARARAAAILSLKLNASVPKEAAASLLQAQAKETEDDLRLMEGEALAKMAKTDPTLVTKIVHAWTSPGLDPEVAARIGIIIQDIGPPALRELQTQALLNKAGAVSDKIKQAVETIQKLQPPGRVPGQVPSAATAK